ncbi:MAG TPA: DNA gyrase inhibitor YacG [Burkholderiales bacterium]|nr:DNA gyrase inhibitor YacG [Burkholderiales bacterium]
MPRIVNCPQCGKPVVWEPANRFRPFCSERCKMIDLGAWASESYRIPVSEDKDSPEDEEGGGEPPVTRKREE